MVVCLKEGHFEPERDEEIALAIYQIGRSRYTKLGKLTKRKILYSQGPSAARWPLLTSVLVQVDWHKLSVLQI